MGSLTVVFDTNVIISAAGFGGAPEECVIRSFEEDVDVAVSPETIEELRRVVEYDHLPFTDEERDVVPLAFVALTGAFEIDPESTVKVTPDPDDDIFLDCALAAAADYVITGDRSFRDVDEHGGVKIRTPAEFLAEIE